MSRASRARSPVLRTLDMGRPPACQSKHERPKCDHAQRDPWHWSRCSSLGTRSGGRCHQARDEVAGAAQADRRSGDSLRELGAREPGRRPRKVRPRPAPLLADRVCLGEGGRQPSATPCRDRGRQPICGAGRHRRLRSRARHDMAPPQSEGLTIATFSDVPEGATDRCHLPLFTAAGAAADAVRRRGRCSPSLFADAATVADRCDPHPAPGEWGESHDRSRKPGQSSGSRQRPSASKRWRASGSTARVTSSPGSGRRPTSTRAASRPSSRRPSGRTTAGARK